MNFTVTSVEELESVAQQLLESTTNSRKYAFQGAVGAGKTTFIKVICRLLGSKDLVNSPTFSIINEYSIKREAAQEQLIYHIDLYRLKTLEEALDIGIEDFLDNEHYCFIEWPQLIDRILPKEINWVSIETLDESTRAISWETKKEFS